MLEGVRLIDRLTIGFGASQPPMHLGLIAGPLCPISESWEPYGLTKVPDGPQAYMSDILRLQEEGAQIHMSE